MTVDIRRALGKPIWIAGVPSLTLFLSTYLSLRFQNFLLDAVYNCPGAISPGTACDTILEAQTYLLLFTTHVIILVAYGHFALDQPITNPRAWRILGISTVCMFIFTTVATALATQLGYIRQGITGPFVVDAAKMPIIVGEYLVFTLASITISKYKSKIPFC